MNWSIQKAKEFCLGVTDGTHDSPKAVDVGRYLITSKHLGEYEIDFCSAKMISEDDYKKVIARSKVGQWDILFSMIGTIGNCYLEKNKSVKYACKNMGIFQMGGDEEKAYWLYYYLKSPQAKRYVLSHLRGSTQQYIPLGSLREFPIPIPEKGNRIKIIDILKSIDGKIETNNKINENLFDQIQAIYSNEFDPSTHTPTGVLADICRYSSDRIPVSELSVSTYFSTENMQPNKMGAVNATSLPSITQTTGCHKGDVLVSNIRPYFKKIVYVTDDNCGCSTDVLCFVPKEDQYSAFLFGTLYMDRFFDYMVAGSKGTKMPRGDKQQIMNYPVVFPDNESLDLFNGLVVPMLDQIATNRIESSRLVALRDALLPKLMSGELDVSELDL